MELLSKEKKLKFLQSGGFRSNTLKAIEKITIKDYHTENKAQAIYATAGMWLFPITIATLSTFGIGEIFSSFLPTWIAYTIAAVLVVLIELGQAAFGRPLMKRIVTGQNITAGMVSRVIGFTLLSIAIGTLSFYKVIINNRESKLVDNSVLLSKSIDSTNKAYNVKNALITSQLKNLETNKEVRFRGLLMQDEQLLQATLNKQLVLNDSMQKAERGNLQTRYPTEIRDSPWSFSPENFAKIMASIFAVLMLGFLTVYSHFLDFKHAKGITDEGSGLVGHSGDDIPLHDSINSELIAKKYEEVYNTMMSIDPIYKPTTLNALLATKSEQEPNSTPTPSTKVFQNSADETPTSQAKNQPTAKLQIGFNSIKKYHASKQETEQNTEKNDLHETRYETRYESREKEEKPEVVIIVKEGYRNCEYCGEPFLYKNSIHKNCCPEHKMLSWEKKTGKTFHRRGQA